MAVVVTTHGMYVLEPEEEFAMNMAVDGDRDEDAMRDVLYAMLVRRRRLEELVFGWTLQAPPTP